MSVYTSRKSQNCWINKKNGKKTALDVVFFASQLTITRLASVSLEVRRARRVSQLKPETDGACPDWSSRTICARGTQPSRYPARQRGAAFFPLYTYRASMSCEKGGREQRPKGERDARVVLSFGGGSFKARNADGLRACVSLAPRARKTICQRFLLRAVTSE